MKCESGGEWEKEKREKLCKGNKDGEGIKIGEKTQQANEGNERVVE